MEMTLVWELYFSRAKEESYNDTYWRMKESLLVNNFRYIFSSLSLAPTIRSPTFLRAIEMLCEVWFVRDSTLFVWDIRWIDYRRHVAVAVSFSSPHICESFGDLRSLSSLLRAGLAGDIIVQLNERNREFREKIIRLATLVGTKIFKTSNHGARNLS